MKCNVSCSQGLLQCQRVRNVKRFLFFSFDFHLILLLLFFFLFFFFPCLCLSGIHQSSPAVISSQINDKPKPKPKKRKKKKRKEKKVNARWRHCFRKSVTSWFVVVWVVECVEASLWRDWLLSDFLFHLFINYDDSNLSYCKILACF